LAAGKSKLGFLNPLLYKSGHNGFTDIVDGHSLGCIGYDIFSGKPAPKIDGAKWSAGVGWDPITGWGVSLDFLWSLLPNTNSCD
jgi:tripeptidyl-peptidase-1